MQQTNVVEERPVARGEDESTRSLVCAAFSASPDGLAVTSSDARLAAWNREFAALWRAPSEIRDGARMLRHVRAQLAEGQELALDPTSPEQDPSVTRIMRCRDDRLIESTSRSLPNGRLWCFRDVTSRERVERELRESEARYRALYKKTPVMMHSITRDGTLLSVSDSWLNALGYERSEVIGRKSTEFMTPESRRRADLVRAEIFRTGHCENVHYEVVTKSGEVRDVLLSAIVDRGSDEGLERSLAVLTDVTERIRVEAERDRLLVDERTARAAAEDALGRLDTVFRSAPVGLAFLDRDLRIVRENDWLAALHGTAPGAEIGMTLYDRMPSIAAEVEPILRRVLETGEQVTHVPIDTEVGGRPGELRSFLASYYPVRTARGDLLGLGVVVVDVTDEKRAVELQARLYREAKAAVRARDDFLAAASHELRTPMTPLALYLQLIRRQLSAGQPVHPEHVDTALCQLSKLSALVNDLLDASLVDLKQLEVHTDPVPVDAIVREVVETARASSSRAIELEIPAQPLVVTGDRLRLVQVVSTLLDNALKYSPPSAPVSVVLERKEPDVVLSIVDRGIGIPPDELPHLFERFFRGRNAPITHYGGLGLGLYICRDIVARHGGRIWAENRPGEGAAFRVVLPLASPETGST